MDIKKSQTIQRLHLVNGQALKNHSAKNIMILLLSIGWYRLNGCKLGNVLKRIIFNAVGGLKLAAVLGSFFHPSDGY